MASVLTTAEIKLTGGGKTLTGWLRTDGSVQCVLPARADRGEEGSYVVRVFPNALEAWQDWLERN